MLVDKVSLTMAGRCASPRRNRKARMSPGATWQKSQPGEPDELWLCVMAVPCDEERKAAVQVQMAEAAGARDAFLKLALCRRGAAGVLDLDLADGGGRRRNHVLFPTDAAARDHERDHRDDVEVGPLQCADVAHANRRDARKLRS